MDSRKHWGVVPAAGSGARMGADIPKQYLEVSGTTILEHTLKTMLGWGFLEQIVVAIADADEYWQRLSVAANTAVRSVTGGAERSDSVLAGLEALAGNAHDDDWVWVHDAARPCVRIESIHRLREALEGEEIGALLALPARETIKLANEAGKVDSTLDRSRVWLAQTPQVFPYQALRQALEQARDSGTVVTDEASAIERLGSQPKLVTGDPANIKLTLAEDMIFAENLLKEGECR